MGPPGCEPHASRYRIVAMSRAFITTALALSLAAPVLFAQGRGGGNAQPPARIPSIEERSTGMQKLDGYFPLYWEERTGALFLEIPRFDPNFCTPPDSPRASDRTTSVWIAARRATGAWFCSSASARRCCWCSRTNRSGLRAPMRRSADRSKIRSPSPSSGDSRSRRKPTDACWWTRPISSCATAHGAGGALRPGTYRVDRTRSAVYMPRTKAFPKNTEIEVTLTFANDAAGGRGGGGVGPSRVRPPSARVRPGEEAVAAGTRGRPVLGHRRERDAQRPKRSLCANIIRWSNLPDSNFKPRDDDPRAGYGGIELRRLQRADRRADGEALHPAPSTGEEGSERGDERAREAHPILGRFRRARGCEESAGRGRELVEPGVRSGRFQECFQGGGAARRRRSHGYPLQHDQLGSPLHARLELRRDRYRSAHGRNHQGHRYARLLARSAGLLDFRRACFRPT